MVETKSFKGRDPTNNGAQKKIGLDTGKKIISEVESNRFLTASMLAFNMEIIIIRFKEQQFKGFLMIRACFLVSSQSDLKYRSKISRKDCNFVIKC